MAKLRIIKQNHKPHIEVDKGHITARMIVEKIILFITGYKSSRYVLTDLSGDVITNNALQTIYL